MSLFARALSTSLAAAMIAAVALSTSACPRAMTFKDDEYRFPADFKGVALILWNVPDGQALERVGDIGRRFVFPPDGVLRLKDPQPAGSRWVKDHPPRFVTVAGDGTTTALASFWAPRPGSPEAELGSSFSRQEGTGPICSGDSVLVGFRTDAEKETLRKEFQGRVQAACAAR